MTTDTAAATTPKQVVIPMRQEKPCKSSIRYAALDPDALVSNVYLARSAASLVGGAMPAAIEVQVRLS